MKNFAIGSGKIRERGKIRIRVRVRVRLQAGARCSMYDKTFCSIQCMHYMHTVVYIISV